MKTMIINIVIAALFGLVYSFVINYFFIPVPTSELSNAIGNAVSGFMSGLMGVLMFFVTNKNVRNYLKRGN